MVPLQKYRIELIIFLTLFICYSYFLPRWADWSQNSRLDLVLAIVDQGTLSIDDYYHNTGDYAFFEGRHYTDKAPGPSFLAVPVYLAAKPILQSGPIQTVLTRLANQPAFRDTLNEAGTGLIEQKIYQAIVLYLVTIVVISFPAALLGLFLYRFLIQLGAGRTWGVIVALIYGLGTSAFPYSGAFFSHQLVAFLLFSSFFIGFQIRRGTLSSRWTLAAGFMLGYSLISEYPTVLIAGAIFLYIVFSIPWRPWLSLFVLAGLPPGLLMMAYNWVIFHTLLPVGYEYSELYTELHSTGFLSLTYPHPEAMWGITFGSFRGLFFVSPVLLLAMLGFWAWWRKGHYKAEWAVCLWATISFMLFNGSSIMWQGGFSIGPRYLVPMIPFMSTGLGALAIHWGGSRRIQIVTTILTIWSMLVIWAETLGGQNFPDWTPNPLVNYSLPNLLANNIARNLGMGIGLHGWSSLLPLGAFLLVMITILIRQSWSDDTEQPIKLRQTQGRFGDEVAQA